MKTTQRIVEQWVGQARTKINNGGIAANDLDELLNAVQQSTASTRQRLLYLHADTPNIKSAIMSMYLHVPVPGDSIQLTTTPDWPYNTVHDAIIDGWRVIHFPQQMAPFDDREIAVLGYEFILEKWEEYSE
jgi:hypothetical protein